MENKEMKGLAYLVFTSEIALQIKIAQRAADILPTVSGPNDTIEAWSSIQLILVSAANVSKILWPNINKKENETTKEREERLLRKERGEHLRNLLGIDKNNIVSNRKFRNHFEHYDERIDEWFSACSSSVYMDLRIGPLKSPFGKDPRLFINKHRWYDPSTKTLLFRGEPINLAAVLDALEEILSKCSPFVLT